MRLFALNSERLRRTLIFDMFFIYLFALIVAIPYDFLFIYFDYSDVARLINDREVDILAAIGTYICILYTDLDFASCTDFTEYLWNAFFHSPFSQNKTYNLRSCVLVYINLSIFLSFCINIKRLLLFSAWISILFILQALPFLLCVSVCVCLCYFVFVMCTYGSFESVIWHIMYGINTHSSQHSGFSSQRPKDRPTHAHR